MLHKKLYCKLTYNLPLNNFKLSCFFFKIKQKHNNNEIESKDKTAICMTTLESCRRNDHFAARLKERRPRLKCRSE
jgi:hypothetical protein